MKQEICAECNKKFTLSEDREEMFDMCDECVSNLQELTRYLSDRNNRMALTRAATHYASNSNNEETRLRAFFACVMPEIPLHKVNKIINKKPFIWQQK